MCVSDGEMNMTMIELWLICAPFVIKMINDPNQGDEDKILSGAIVMIGFIIAAIIYLRGDNS